MFKKLFAVGFILVAGAISAMAAGTDTGIVKDDQGVIVTGVTVTYTRAALTWTAVTDSNGVYRFPLGRNSTVTIINAGAAGNLVATKIGYVNSNTQAMTVVVADTIGGAIKGNPTLNITIRKTTGSINDSAGFAPIVGARIQLKRAAAVIDSTVSAGDGSYTLTHVNAADTLIVMAPSYVMQKKLDNNNSATVALNTVNFLLQAYGRIAGIVTDSMTGLPLGKAKISLYKVVGGVAQPPFTTTLTDSITGVYAFDSIAAHFPYQVSAYDSLYIMKVKQISSKSTVVDSVNFALGPTTSGIIGIITADSLHGSILVGAKVVLKKGTVTVDSTVTDTLGSYAFAKDSVNVSYTVTASFNGYQTISTPLVKTSVTNVVSFFLPEGNIKTFYVKVLGVGITTAPLANASVGFTNGASVIGALTNAAGVAVLPNAPTGFDSITVADTLFTAQRFFLTVSPTPHLSDTVTYSISQVTQGTVQRAIRGTAHTTSTTGAVAAGATIVFKTAGSWVYVAKSIANGTWSAVGIDASVANTGSIPIFNVTTGRGLHATYPGWTDYFNLAAINIGATGTTTYNNVVFATTGVIPSSQAMVSGKPAFSVLHSGIISLSNMTMPGMVKVYNLQGQVLYSHAFEANTASVHVPALMQGKTAFVVSVTQAKAEFHQVVVMP